MENNSNPCQEENKKDAKDYSKSQSIEKARSLLHPFTAEEKSQRNKFFNQATTLISISAICATLLLYQYNTGYCKVYNIPISTLPLSLEKYIPLCLQLLFLSHYVLFYVSSIKTDTVLNKRKFDLVRCLWSFMFFQFILFQNRVDKHIGVLLCYLISISISLLFEFIFYARNRPIKDKKLSKIEYQYKVEDIVNNYFYNRFYIKSGLAFLVIASFIAPHIGTLSATTKSDYQTCFINNDMYTVIVDNNDKYLLQASSLDNSILTIYTDTYIFHDKTDLSFIYSTYDNVSIVNSKTIHIEDKQFDEIEETELANNSSSDQ